MMQVAGFSNEAGWSSRIWMNGDTRMIHEIFESMYCMRLVGQ